MTGAPSFSVIADATHQVDGIVVKAVHGHLKGSTIPAALSKYARLRRAAVRHQFDVLDGRISKLTGLVIEMENPRPMLVKIDGLDQERGKLQLECAAVDERVTEGDVAKILEGIAGDFEAVPQIALKAYVSTLVEKLELNPAALTSRNCYRISATNRRLMASPRGFEPLLPL